MVEELYQEVAVFERVFIFFPATLLFFEKNESLDELLKLLLYDRENKKVMSKAGLDSKYDIETIETLALYFNNEILMRERINSTNWWKDEIKVHGVEINTINNCNLNCKYCFACGGHHGKNSILDIEGSKQAIDYIFQNTDAIDTITISLIGGEPLLNFKVIEFMLDYSTKKAEEYHKKINFITTTNGTLITEENWRVLNKYNVNVMLSLDSSDKKVNDYLRPLKNGGSSYEIIMNDAWNLIISQGERSKIHTTITKDNANIYETAKSFYEMGISGLHIKEVVSDLADFKMTPDLIDSLKSEFEKITRLLLQSIKENKPLKFYPLMDNIERLYKRNPMVSKCGVLNKFFAISPDLQIYPCDMLMWDEYKLGHIHNGINMDRVNELRKKLIDNVKCDQCWGRYLCGGECLSELLILKDDEERELRCELKLFIIKLQLYIFYALQKDYREYLKKYLTDRFRKASVHC